MIRVLIVSVLLSGCAGAPSAQKKSFYNVDSLISFQVNNLKGKYELNKLVEIDGKKEETRFVPDSLQWAGELQIFRQIDQINKGAFRDAYVVNDSRDVNSNLTVREIRAQGETDVPVSVVKFFYLRDISDLRKIEATLLEENTLYVNTRRLTIQFEPANSIHLVQRFRIEGLQKMVMNDSVRFVIAGEIGI
ncbi:MAG TPA: hypothetical protein VFE50_06455 [Cyclobacteriaceae bacterium]|nr:hypothetical protein [Cyclobacteriaceae bacterium]